MSLVAVCAVLRCVAIRAMAAARGEGPVKPGLEVGRSRLDDGWIIALGLQTRRGLVLKIVEFNAEGFAAMEIVEESSVGFLDFGCVLLREVHEV